ncbi:DUF488 family protein [Tianweitania sediminis]|uniref:DUF488 domain-containing protein n=1 Tax=Tianweitania sediminis TaxID=1502156 RepID=A0A8J7UIP9_9HYPH|nr:DUF488 domain-containing protein [Tianweitania sediminis]MBP0438045.1 DUF488 domain-containing protein [Tianweitania sediminis]
MDNPFFSVGHSTRSIEDFVALLRAGSVDSVVDIRTVPRSRTNPQYNTDTIANHLAPYQIGYTHLAELGGLRKKRKADQDDTNAFWTNQSFRNYADYAMSQSFQEGLERLIRLGRERRVAMMCSEAVWWRCHRRLVADYLLARGEAVFHLMGGARVEPATLTLGARPHPDGTIGYPSA